MKQPEISVAKLTRVWYKDSATANSSELFSPEDITRYDVYIYSFRLCIDLTALIWTAYLLGNFTHRYISHVDSTLDFLAFMFRHIFPVAKDPSVLSSQDFDAFSNYKSNGKTSLALSDSLNTSPSLAFLALYDVV
ncbi:hypothetical protein NC653_025700 [Populus alba x Populus x berolinensis]|uniref:Uncharacterized protein n=1 Tax=Populus alba x Populus x berolinensis TaxID=444605 RepID=A0AAD6MBX3_9ROSI|nr:hypothetical protein NC653_025700 [Populus alba x Populus x berolinensis]